MKRTGFLILVLVPLIASTILLSPRQATSLNLTVNTTDDNDDGVCNSAHCSLREAINASNAPRTSAVVITFNLPATSRTIHPANAQSTFPEITRGNVTLYASDPMGKPTIELAGNPQQVGCGLTIPVPGVTVRGFVINRFPCGIQVGPYNPRTIQRTTIAGNYIGTNMDGTQGFAGQMYGVKVIEATASIGTVLGSDRNVISGNTYGVYVFTKLGFNEGSSVNTLIEGNYIGTDPTGTTAVPNDTGIYAEDYANVRVNKNVISGNRLNGVESHLEWFTDTETGQINVSSNLIGLTASGINALGNGKNGVAIFDNPGSVHSNVISANGQNGVYYLTVYQSNYTSMTVMYNKIGTDISGTQPLGNGQAGISMGSENGLHADIRFNTIAFSLAQGILIRGGRDNIIDDNAIFGNEALGIDLYPLGIHPNNSTDIYRPNYPVLARATSDGQTTLVTGRLNGPPNVIFSIRFYTNTACDPSGYGEGERMLTKSISATPNANGQVSFSASLPAVAPGQWITATAKASSATVRGNTSEFSACVQVVAGATPTPLPISPTPSITPTSTHTNTPEWLVPGYYEQSKSMIRYWALPWATISDPSASGGSYRQSKELTARISFSFRGSKLTLLRMMGPNRGQVRVCIDQTCQLIDNYSPTVQYQQPVSFWTSDANAVHVAEISNTSNQYLDLDAVRVETVLPGTPTPSPTATRAVTSTPTSVAQLHVPVLIAPANGASTVPKPTFEWQPVPRADRYRFYLATDPNFINLVSNQAITTTTYTRSYSLPGGMYYWKVRAGDQWGQIGPWSEVRSLTVGTATASIPTATLTPLPSITSTVAPTNLATATPGCPAGVPSGVTARRHTPQADTHTLLLEWEDISAPCEAVVSFKVYVWRGTYHQEWEFNRADIECNGTVCKVLIVFSSSQSQIYWRVTATNMVGEGPSDNSKSYIVQ